MVGQFEYSLIAERKAGLSSTLTVSNGVWSDFRTSQALLENPLQENLKNKHTPMNDGGNANKNKLSPQWSLFIPFHEQHHPVCVDNVGNLFRDILGRVNG
jgi:hypothetical protein